MRLSIRWCPTPRASVRSAACAAPCVFTRWDSRCISDADRPIHAAPLVLAGPAWPVWPLLPATAAGHAERLQITKVELFKVIVPMQEDIISSPEFGTDAQVDPTGCAPP